MRLVECGRAIKFHECLINARDVYVLCISHVVVMFAAINGKRTFRENEKALDNRSICWMQTLYFAFYILTQQMCLVTPMFEVKTAGWTNKEKGRKSQNLMVLETVRKSRQKKMLGERVFRCSSLLAVGFSFTIIEIGKETYATIGVSEFRQQFMINLAEIFLLPL